MQTITLKVQGMTCMGCVNSVKRLLTALAGVGQVEVDLSQGRVEVVYDPARVQPHALKQAIEEGGYQIVPE